MTFSLEKCIMFSSKVGDYIEKYLQAAANKVLIVEDTRQIGKSYMLDKNCSRIT